MKKSGKMHAPIYRQPDKICLFFFFTFACIETEHFADDVFALYAVSYADI